MKAFPTPTISVSEEARITSIGGEGGMDLRDYFAAKAMPVVLTYLWQQGKHESPVSSLAAKFSYEVADSMMKARKA